MEYYLAGARRRAGAVELLELPWLVVFGPLPRRPAALSLMRGALGQRLPLTAAVGCCSKHAGRRWHERLDVNSWPILCSWPLCFSLCCRLLPFCMGKSSTTWSPSSSSGASSGPRGGAARLFECTSAKVKGPTQFMHVTQCLTSQPRVGPPVATPSTGSRPSGAAYELFLMRPELNARQAYTHDLRMWSRSLRCWPPCP